MTRKRRKVQLPWRPAARSGAPGGRRWWGSRARSRWGWRLWDRSVRRKSVRWTVGWHRDGRCRCRPWPPAATGCSPARWCGGATPNRPAIACATPRRPRSSVPDSVACWPRSTSAGKSNATWQCRCFLCWTTRCRGRAPSAALRRCPRRRRRRRRWRRWRRWHFCRCPARPTRASARARSYHEGPPCPDCVDRNSPKISVALVIVFESIMPTSCFLFIISTVSILSIILIVFYVFIILIILITSIISIILII